MLWLAHVRAQGVQEVSFHDQAVGVRQRPLDGPARSRVGRGLLRTDEAEAAAMARQEASAAATAEASAAERRAVDGRRLQRLRREREGRLRLVQSATARLQGYFSHDA